MAACSSALMLGLGGAAICDEQSHVRQTTIKTGIFRMVSEGDCSNEYRTKSMEILNDTGLFDLAVLNQEIEAILQENSWETSGQDDAGNFQACELVQDHVETVIRAGRSGEVPQAAERVFALLSLDLDDLRKAALLSLIVRLIGKRKFDPVTAYVLEKRATYVTGRG